MIFARSLAGAVEVDTSEEVELKFNGAGWCYSITLCVILSICYILPTDKVVVGVSSDAVLERNPAVSPGNQLAQATEYLDVGSNSPEICFSFDVCNTTTSLFPLALSCLCVSRCRVGL